MEKVALIELNEIDLKLVMMNVAPGGYFNVFDRIDENIRLGQTILKEGIITAGKITETLSILRMFRKVCENNGVSKVVSICTSFIKDAKNQKSFFDEIYNNTSFTFSILSLDEEVKAIYNGIVNFIDVPKGVIVDVEANNTHIIHYNRRTILNITTLPFGAVSTADKKIKYSEIVEKVKQEYHPSDLLMAEDRDIMFVGTGQTMVSIGKLAKRVAHYPLDIDNNYVVQSEVFDAVFDKVKDLDLNQTARLKGVSEERADYFVSGMAIVKGIIEALKIDNFSISSGGLDEGLVYSYVVPETNDKPLSDMLTYSLDCIRTFYDPNNSNTQNVYNLALILFKQLKVMHKLPRAYVKPLRIASSMYDCGKRINFENYTKYSLDIIINSRLNGVSHKDLLLAGFACKCQNLDDLSLSEWVKYKDILTEDDLDAVRKLGVIINLASKLDSSKSGNVYDISCDILGDSIIMKTIVKNDASFDIRQAMKLAPVFKKILKKNLQII